MTVMESHTTKGISFANSALWSTTWNYRKIEKGFWQSNTLYQKRVRLLYKLETIFVKSCGYVRWWRRWTTCGIYKYFIIYIFLVPHIMVYHGSNTASDITLNPDLSQIYDHDIENWMPTGLTSGGFGFRYKKGSLNWLLWKENSINFLKILKMQKF